MNFRDIRGHSATLAALKAMLASGRVPPSLIFHGPDGVGKLMAAKAFVRALNCTGKPAPQDDGGLFGPAEPGPAPAEEEKPCGLCDSCRQFEKNVHPDMRVIDADFQGLLLDEEAKKQRALKIETVREFTKHVYRKPSLSAWKAFVVDDAHTLNANAQNAMLKCLEEPPERTVFVLVASQKQFLLPTILSRCHQVAFRPLPAEDLREILQGLGTAPAEAARLSALSGGSVRKALEAGKLLAKLAAPGAGPLKISQSLPKELYLARDAAGRLLEMLTFSARDKWRASEGPAKEACFRLLERLAAARRMLGQNVSPALLIETSFTEAEKAGVRLG